MLRRNKVFLTLAIIAVVLIAVRAALPYVIKDRVNATLHGLEAYDGHVEDIDLALWRGAYRVEGIHVDKRAKGDRKENTPFFNANVIDVSVEWRSLMKGSLVAEVVFDRPSINLVQEDEPEESQLGQDENWQEEFKQLFPFRFNTVEIREGTVTLLAPGIQTKDALKAEHVNGGVSNLTNVANANKETFADFGLEALVLGDAPARVSGSLDPWAKEPTFDVNLEVKQVKLPKVNPWLREFIKADAEAGDFELFMEIAAAEGKFKGYAKPILQNVNMTSSEEKDGALRKLWEGILDFAANVLENEKEDQVAARAPFTGTIENPEASIWATIASVVRNAFVSAFARSLEGSVSLRDVRENLSTISEGGEEKADKDEKVSKSDSGTKKQEKSDASEAKREAKRDTERDEKRFGPRGTG
jgi:hypothetical protein